jgi:hypothetical protein
VEGPENVAPKLPPAVIIHGLADARDALALGLPLTLLSAPGAAVYAGVGWWIALIAAAHAEHPHPAFTDILDCADSPGRAAEAIREGQRQVVLVGTPRLLLERVEALAAECGAVVLAEAPPALDLAQPGARRRLAGWLGPT